MTFHNALDTETAQVPEALKHVVVINDHCTPNGGAAVLMLMFVRGLRHRGVNVTVITGDAGDNPDLHDMGVEVVAAGGSDLLHRPKLQAATRGVHNPEARAMVARVIAERDSPGTVYHVHNWSQILTPSIFLALRPVAERTFLHGHDAFLACPNGMFMDYQRDTICERVPLSAACLATHCDKRSYPHKLWRVARHASLYQCLDRKAPWAGVITIHPRVAPKFRRAGYPDDLLKIVRNPAQSYTTRRVQAEDNRMLVYVGRLEADKGVLDLVQSARRTHQRVRLIGTGSLQDTLRLDYPEVELAGWRSHDQIGSLVADARALVMPSRHPETFGLVIAEAVASGLPVLVSDTGNLAEDVQELGFGFAFDVFDRGSMDAAMIRMRDMAPTDIRDMSVRCRDLAGRMAHSPDTWCDAIIALFADAVQAGSIIAQPATAG